MVARPRKSEIRIAGQTVELDAPGFKQVPRKNKQGEVIKVDLYWVADEEVPDYVSRSISASPASVGILVCLTPSDLV